MSYPPASARRLTLALAAESVFAIETLEGRRLLSVTLPKIGDTLSYLATDFATRPAATQSRAVNKAKPYVLAANQPNATLLRTSGDAVLVKAVAKSVGAAALVKQLTAIGATVSSSYGRMVSAAVPVAYLKKVSTLSGLAYADASYAPYTAAGTTDDLGTQAIGASAGGAKYAVDGTGTTVGILSDSYNLLGGASAGVASGDLPSGVSVVKEGPSGSTDEGRAMAEIVHDVAPGAGVAFYSAFYGEADFASGIISLAKPLASGGAGAKVIVDDVGYFDEPFFQEGVVAQAVDRANGQYGASYFSAAGNAGRSSYESVWRPTTATTTVAGAGTGTFQDFDSGTGVTPYQTVTIPAGSLFQITLQWDTPFLSASTAAGGSNGATNSLSAYLVNAADSGLLTAQTTNRVGGDGYQVLAYQNRTGATITARLAIKSAYGAQPGFLKWVGASDANVTTDFTTNSGTAIGHAVATGGLAVGAAYYKQTPAFGTSPAVTESFSSAGGTPIFFSPDGTRLTTTQYRNQPAITAVDGGQTTFFNYLDTSEDGQYRFFGTSAAAPHAAAVAALLVQANPSLIASQVYSTLEATALDTGTAGFDYDGGYGLIQADKALAAVAASSITGTVYADANANGVKDSGETGLAGQTVFLDANGNGVVDTGSGTVTSPGALAIPDSAAATAVPSRVSRSGNTPTTITGRVTGITVTLNATAARTGDLGFTLITPAGIRIPLLTDLGGFGAAGTGINVTLSDAAAAYVQDATYGGGTVSGTYRPQTPLAAALGENAAGAWQIEARDYKSGATGTLNGWSLGLTYADTATTTDSSGNYAFTGLTPSAYYGTYAVRQVTPAGYVQTGTTAYNLTVARSSVNSGNDFGDAAASALSTVANLVLDDGTAQRSMIRSATVTFSGTIPPAGIAAGAFRLTQTSGTVTPYTVNVASLSTTADVTTAVLTFAGSAVSGGSVANGRYSLVIDGSKITDSSGRKVDAAGTGVAGSSRTTLFFRDYGDINGSATTDFTDFLSFQAAFGSKTGNAGFLGGFDSDANGAIDFTDFLAFQANFGNVV